MVNDWLLIAMGLLGGLYVGWRLRTRRVRQLEGLLDQALTHLHASVRQLSVAQVEDAMCEVEGEELLLESPAHRAMPMSEFGRSRVRFERGHRPPRNEPYFKREEPGGDPRPHTAPTPIKGPYFERKDTDAEGSDTEAGGH